MRVALALLVFGLAVAGWFAAAATAAPENAAVDRYGACLASQKLGDLLVLVDESGSLKKTDTQAARVQAAKYLVETLGRYADRTNSHLEVAIAGFSEGYTMRQDWTPLTGASVDSVDDGLQSLAGRDDGLDTDYWMALDGARQSLAARAQGNPDRCQAIAWFSDGKLDFAQRPGNRPYAGGVDLGSSQGVAETVRRATHLICRSGGLADQLRSAHIVMLGVGLGDNASDFDVMSAITTGAGPNGTTCGDITDPKPGAFYRVSDIDQMLFAFDALNPGPGVDDSKPVCRQTVCPQARHNFVLDPSVKSVHILGSGGMPGIVPYLISPSGRQLRLPKRDGNVDTGIDGMPVSYKWRSGSAQTVSLHGADSPKWPGQWAIVYVDTTGEHPDAVSRVSIHITTDIYPALVSDPGSWHAGQTRQGVRFGLVDAQGNPVDPNGLAGRAVMSAVLDPRDAAPLQLLTSVPKDAIAKPVDVDLTGVAPGPATLRMSLVITTAPAPDAPGTTLSPQKVDVPVQILPKIGLPAPGKRIDFGTVEGANGATARLKVTGPGCVWIADGEPTTIAAAPDGIGNVSLTSTAAGPADCLKVDPGQQGDLPVTLRTEHNGHGGLNGTVPVHIAPEDNPGEAQTVDVTFVGSLVNPLSTTNFVLVFLAALLLGPGIPLALLYAAKWYVGKIPDAPMLAQRIPVEVDADVVLRDGEPFQPADTDLVTPVPGLAGGARRLTVAGVDLSTVTGRSPFGTAHVGVDASGYVSAGSDMPSTDDTGLRAVLPLAVHGTWVVLHDPAGAANRADVLLMVHGQADVAARQKIYADIERRLPELLTGLRRRALEAELVPAREDDPQTASPFGAAPVPTGGDDPFTDTSQDPGVQDSPLKRRGGA